MPQSSPTPTKPDAAALNAAFDALKSYDHGSGRGALVPIDEAVMASLDDKSSQRELEQRLVTALKQGGSAVAREYICTKLTLIGWEVSVPALAPLLNTPEFATAARNTLEAIPGNRATKALRASLTKVEGLQKVGVINSLGERRDADSVRALTALLKHPDTRIAGAVAAALGDIGTSQAGKALREFLPKAPDGLRLKVADAVLACADRLLAADKRVGAKALYQLLVDDVLPKYIQHAAARGLSKSTG